MKKMIASWALLFTLLLRVSADEGMWLPLLLGQKTYDDMVKKGCKLTKEQIFSLNKNSMKDAIVIFGGGCTGEIVSDKGLIFTNHHCGYDAIADLSSVENNYLKDGYYAPNTKSEMEAKGLSVQFLKNIIDVTEEILPALGDLTGADRQKKYNELAGPLIAKYSNKEAFLEARISNFFKGNQYLLFVYERYTDVRFVGCPPELIGKYGGDTDNWEWTRHTGDFSVFRVYTTKDGKPAAYNADNVPMKPRHFLPVSMKGVKEGDFNMILGYPGGTNRFEVSDGVELQQDYFDPNFVKCRDIRLKAMKVEMDKSPENRLKLASEYAGLANYWKFYDLEGRQLKQRGIAAQKRADEQKFQAWANGKADYQNILADYKTNIDAWKPFEKQRQYFGQGIMGSTLVAWSSQLIPLEAELAKATPDAGKVAGIIKGITEAVTAGKANYVKEADQNIFGSIGALFYKGIDKAQHPAGFFEKLQGKYGDLNSDDNWKKYAADAFASSLLLDESKWSAFAAKPAVEALNNDWVYQHAKAFLNNWNGNYVPKLQAYNFKNATLGRFYVKGLMEMNKGRVEYYPDANSTMRFTYGKVASYAPRDAVKYDYITTATGILQKYREGDEEFGLPARCLDLLRKKDFGQYIDPVRKDLVVNFLNTCDITGGNSGSPVINGKGELIGLAFDGNAEAISHKITFDPTVNRTICVDIRYVLWCIDKLGGAPHLIKELKLVR
jgi:hypothetical protein